MNGIVKSEQNNVHGTFGQLHSYNYNMLHTSVLLPLRLMAKIEKVS